jgi:hypothetical protein
MGETQAKKPGVRPSLTFVFVHADNGRRQFPMLKRSESWWQRWRMWMQYHSTQLRWDIERSLARLFNRRWGG